MENLLRVRMWFVFLIICYSVLALNTVTFAKDEEVVFSVIGDIPYSAKDVKTFKRHVEEHNNFSLSEFLVHVGDLRGTSSGCDESEYTLVADILLDLKVPAFVVPGDNEWVDCKKPDKAWGFWAKHFIGFESNFCGTPKTEHQSVRPENFAFVKKGVLFIGVNMVAGRDYEKKSEKRQRLEDNSVWLNEQFDKHSRDIRAAVVFGHALESSDDDFSEALTKVVEEFGKPVVYIQGNKHSYKVKEEFLTKDLTKVVVPQGGRSLPLQVTVNVDKKHMFEFTRKPWDKDSPIIKREPCGGYTETDDSNSDGVTEDVTPEEEITPQLSFKVNPSGYDFGAVPVDESKEKTFTLENTGDVKVEFTEFELIGADAGVFKLQDKDAFTVGVGQTHSFVVSFNPESTGEVKATLRLHYSDGEFDISLSGEGEEVVVASEFTFPAAADAYVRSSKPTRNYGKSKVLTLRKTSSTYSAYVKFEVDGLAQSVKNAIVRLVADRGAEGGVLYAVPNDWEEYEINWSNAPPPISSPLGSAGPVRKGDVVEFDVTEVVRGNGIFSFCILSDSRDKMNYLSREKGQDKGPKLFVSLGDAPVTISSDPAPVITSIEPRQGTAGTEVTITGTALAEAYRVEINNVSVGSFEIDSDTQIRLTLPGAASTGELSVRAPSGVDRSDEVFEVLGTTQHRFVASHDSYVRSSRLNEENGDAGTLQIRTASAVRNAYLKFDVSGVHGVLQSAKVLLLVTDGSDQAGTMYTVSNYFEGSSEPWTEGKLTWANAPAISGKPLSSPGAMIDDEIAEFDVSAVVTGDGTYSFAIADGSLDRIKYRSKEKGRDHSPTLVIETLGTIVAKSSPAEDPPLALDENSRQVELPEVLRLGSAYPNPFNAETNIQYDLPASSDVSLVVFNIRGQHVRTLVSGVQKPGIHKIQWDGRDANHTLVATGSYIIRLHVGQQRMVQKVTLIK